jgi:hypothetical protein
MVDRGADATQIFRATKPAVEVGGVALSRHWVSAIADDRGGGEPVAGFGYQQDAAAAVLQSMKGYEGG